MTSVLINTGIEDIDAIMLLMNRHVVIQAACIKDHISFAQSYMHSSRALRTLALNTDDSDFEIMSDMYVFHRN